MTLRKPKEKGSAKKMAKKTRRQNDIPKDNEESDGEAETEGEAVDNNQVSMIKVYLPNTFFL